MFALRLGRLLVAALLVTGAGIGRAEASAIGLTSSVPGSLYTINTSTGAATFLVNLSGAAVDTSLVGLDFLGGVLYASDVSIESAFTFGSINIATGAYTVINTQGGSANWHSLAANEAGGFLYTVDQDDSNKLKTVTPGGVINTIGSTGHEIVGLAYENATGALFGVDDVSSLYSINTATGASTLIGSLGFTCFQMGLDIDQTTGTMYLNTGADCAGGQLFTVNKSTGLATLVGPNGATAGHGIDGIAIQDTVPVPAPEPATVVLVGSALALARARRRTRRREI